MWFPQFRLQQRAKGINRYTNAEFANIHGIYALANGNRRVVVPLYGGKFPKSRQLDH